ILNQCIHSGFGLSYFKEMLTGPEYADRMIRKLKKLDGMEISLKTFVIRLNREKVLTVLKPGQMLEIQASALIMATGCRERTREMAHIAGTRPAGIFPAGLAQKLVNIEGLMPGRAAVIVGSGDIGLIMARRFTLEGGRVQAVVEIHKQSKGLTRNVVQCLEDFDIPLYLGHRISRIYGRDRVAKVDIVKVDDNLADLPQTTLSLPCDTVLISAGLIPENELIEMAGAAVDPATNRPVSAQLNHTSIPGLFVCGNAFQVYDLADTVTRDSEKAGQQAAEYLRV
ncbi:MAG: FAD-dependent oxidoreductase, partial [Candidatus Omnitrophica bacterium]|nr:FAD-dependent oxidoreductase [Candidatus Omnitrophota bacterium]